MALWSKALVLSLKEYNKMNKPVDTTEKLYFCVPCCCCLLGQVGNLLYHLLSSIHHFFFRIVDQKLTWIVGAKDFRISCPLLYPIPEKKVVVRLMSILQPIARRSNVKKSFVGCRSAPIRRAGPQYNVGVSGRPTHTPLPLYYYIGQTV